MSASPPITTELVRRGSPPVCATSGREQLQRITSIFDHLSRGASKGEGNSAASIRGLTNTQAHIRPAKTGSLSVRFRAEPAIWRLRALIAAAAFHMVNSSVACDLGSECKFALDRATRRHCGAIGK